MMVVVLFAQLLSVVYRFKISTRFLQSLLHNGTSAAVDRNPDGCFGQLIFIE